MVRSSESCSKPPDPAVPVALRSTSDRSAIATLKSKGAQIDADDSRDTPEAKTLSVVLDTSCRKGYRGWEGDDDDMQLLQRLPEIETLTLSCNIKNQQRLGFLQKLPKLKRIVFRGTCMTDDGARQLAQCTALHDVQALTCLTDTGMRCLMQMKQLRVLYLYCRRVTDEGINESDNLENVEVLAVLCAKITDRGFQKLSKLPRLQELDVSGTPVTDASIPVLLQCKGLRRLGIGGTAFTEKGVERLRSGLPECKIEWKDH
jgi:hypothetical protein